MVILVLLVVVALRMWGTANRLDRLHVRTAAAWAALEGTLSRRIAVVRAGTAAGGFPSALSEQLRRVTTAADQADRAARADLENDLTRTIAALPAVSAADLAAELADAGERITLARRFYNDAVRDTRALRAARLTRWFRLAGRAVLPDYFEIADPNIRLAVRRTAARVVLLDDSGRTLLFSNVDAEGREVWFTPGGGVEPGEDLAQAALRELAEETGLRLPATELAGPLWRRTATFPFAGALYEQTEFYFAALAPDGFAPNHDGFTAIEAANITGHRWFTAGEMRGLIPGMPTVVYPVELAARLAEATAAAGHPALAHELVTID